MHSQGHTSTQVHTSTRPKASIHRLRMQRFFSSAASSSAGSAERPATAWQLKDVQRWLREQEGCGLHDPPPNGLWFFLVPATSESGGASTDFMGSRYIDSDEAAIQGATKSLDPPRRKARLLEHRSADVLFSICYAGHCFLKTGIAMVLRSSPERSAAGGCSCVGFLAGSRGKLCCSQAHTAWPFREWHGPPGE